MHCILHMSSSLYLHQTFSSLFFTYIYNFFLIKETEANFFQNFIYLITKYKRSHSNFFVHPSVTHGPEQSVRLKFNRLKVLETGRL